MVRPFNADTQGSVQDELFAVVQPKSGSILCGPPTPSRLIPNDPNQEPQTVVEPHSLR
jgi:hypothetical protein